MSKLSSTGTVGSRRTSFENLSRGDIFDVLRNQRRRHVLHYLKRYESPVELRDMATHIAAWENETTPEQVTSDQRRRVYTTLQQTHLPKMDRAGIVEYDSSRGTIEQTEHTPKLDVYLEIVPGYEFSWREYYLALGATSCALVVAVWMGIYPFSLLPNVFWMALIAGGLVASATIQIFHERNMRLGAGDKPPELE